MESLVKGFAHPKLPPSQKIAQRPRRKLRDYWLLNKVCDGSGAGWTSETGTKALPVCLPECCTRNRWMTSHFNEFPLHYFSSTSSHIPSSYHLPILRTCFERFLLNIHSSLIIIIITFPISQSSITTLLIFSSNHPSIYFFLLVLTLVTKAPNHFSPSRIPKSPLSTTFLCLQCQVVTPQHLIIGS